MLSAPANPDSPPFDSIETALRRAAAPADAAEVHGSLCGMLCVLGGRASGRWLGDVLADAGGDAAAVDEAGRLLGALATATGAALEAGEMGFQPLLPPDEQPLEYRVASLAQWCQGFNYGLAVAAALVDADAALEADDIAEIVEDLAALGLADAGSDDPEEEVEAAYAQLVEYIRVGVQLVFDALTDVRQNPPPGELH